jgi:hypothetical protein
MNLKRREFLLFLSATTSIFALKNIATTKGKSSLAATQNNLNFKPVTIPLPLKVEELETAQQKQIYSNYQVKDELILPEGFTYDIIAAWGDRVGNSRFGYNNDYLSFRETETNAGLLTVNFEYISGKTWRETYPLVIGKQLPFAEVMAKAAATEGEIDAFNLSEDDPLKAQIQAIAKEGLIDQGIGVISLKRNSQGKWERTYSEVDRRITGISGLDNSSESLNCTGPAVAVFTKQNKLGYEDKLGSRIIGTFQNCAGGTTPWGTVFSAEENVQDQIPEEVMADGSSVSPSAKPFLFDEKDIDGRANAFGLAGNKYGWLVEIDPANPKDYGTKHTWLGRYRHEAFGIRAVAAKNLAIYSGCDRRGGHLYKFISAETIQDPKDPANSRLLEQGMLYGAKFNADGTGSWIPLTLETAVNPVLPSQVVGGLVSLPNPNRQAGGIITIAQDREAQAFSEQFKTLADLYYGDSELEKQGAILIDAHFAANAAGITCTARPEDTIVAEDGTLYIAFTSGSPGDDGGPDLEVFPGLNGEEAHEPGWIMKLIEDNQDPGSLTFRWSMFAMGGEPALGGAGFANPDNLEIDSSGNVWMVTDMSTSSHNKSIPTRVEEGQPLTSKDLTGVFGNNSLWYLPTSGSLAGEAYPFAIGPMECECTGLFFSNDEQTLFLAVQHPGENEGMRQDMATETREFVLLTTDGQTFKQQRQVPLGSNWPSNKTNQPPRPAVVAIRRLDNQKII